MISDLDYFHESYLGSGDVTDFFESLPNHLQGKFKQCYATDIVYWGNVLHGFRGPSNFCDGSSGDSEVLPPSHGLTEIKFRWGLRLWINITTVWIAMGIQKANDHLEWRSLYFDSKTGECLSHDISEAADKLCAMGDQLFEQGNYAEAAEYYNNARRAGSHHNDSYQEQSFEDNAMKAESELTAMSLNSEGDHLFGEGKYGEAIDKYREAYGKSQVCGQYRLYEANCEKAQIESDAANLSLHADSLVERGEYSDAISKYQEAHDKSQCEKEKNKYSSKRAQATANKLLEALWQKAWDAENDISGDRSEEARKTFQILLSESKNSLKIFPDNSKLKHYESLATLKVRGNAWFNRGLESQKNAIALSQSSEQQEKCESAKKKFEQANNYFQQAREQFEMGSESDQRFVSCVEIVKERINEVMQSIEMIERSVSSSKLSHLVISITDKNDLDIDSHELDRAVNHKTYYNQI